MPYGRRKNLWRVYPPKEAGGRGDPEGAGGASVPDRVQREQVGTEPVLSGCVSGPRHLPGAAHFRTRIFHRLRRRPETRSGAGGSGAAGSGVRPPAAVSGGLCHCPAGLPDRGLGRVPQPGLVLDRAGWDSPVLLPDKSALACPPGTCFHQPGCRVGLSASAPDGLLELRRRPLADGRAGNHGGQSGSALELVGGLAALRKARDNSVRGADLRVGVPAADGNLGVHGRGLAVSGGVSSGGAGGGLPVGLLPLPGVLECGPLAEGRGVRPDYRRGLPGL